MNRRTGDVIPIEADSITWESTVGTNASETLASGGPSVELDRIGLWKTSAGLTGSASLLSVDETLLPTAEAVASDTQAQLASTFFSGDLTPWMMWLALIALVVESWLYHRYWIF
jgi:hypothetical protein